MTTRTGTRTTLAAAALVLVVLVAGACAGEAARTPEARRGPANDPIERVEPEPIEPVEPVEPEPVEPEPVEPEPVEPEPLRAVVVNGVGLDEGTLLALEAELGWAVADGDYWYDPLLGAVGFTGGPTAGFLPAGLAIGGPLAPDASGGTTGVFLNGRELPPDDLALLEQLFAAPFPPDRYVLDAAGNYGYEGEAPLGNLFTTFEQQQQQPTGGGGPVETEGGWIGGNSSDGYYFDPESGCSVMAGEGVSC